MQSCQPKNDEVAIPNLALSGVGLSAVWRRASPCCDDAVLDRDPGVAPERQALAVRRADCQLGNRPPVVMRGFCQQGRVWSMLVAHRRRFRDEREDEPWIKDS